MSYRRPKQRVMIAMASLPMNPNFLIADEPTTALDVPVQNGVRTLKELSQGQDGDSADYLRI